MIDYKLFQSQYIVENQYNFIQQCIEVSTLLQGKDTTVNYNLYNIFSITAGSVYFYNLYKELNVLIRSQLPNGMLWMQAWVNMHTEDEVLDWHNHDWPYHGYISIDPKNTFTDFGSYQIKNKIGQIYFGEGNRLHKVNVAESFEGKRITIGYDVTNDPVMYTGCLGYVPII